MEHDVSVIICTYNDEPYIQASIQSILDQEVDAMEIIVLDDGSTDQTLKLINDMHDSRIKLISQDNQGIAAARHQAICASHSPLIMIQDGDDTCHPKRMTYQRDYLNNHPEIDVVGTGVMAIDEAGLAVYPKQFPKSHYAIIQAMAIDNCFCGPSIMFRRSLYDQVGGYRALFQTCEDYDLLLRMTEQGQSYNLPEVLYYRRINPESLSMTKLDSMKAYHQLARLCAHARKKNKSENLEKKVRLINKRLANNQTSVRDQQKQVEQFLAIQYQSYAILGLYFTEHKKARKYFTKAIHANGLSLKNGLGWLLTFAPSFILKIIRKKFKGTIKTYIHDGQGNEL